MDGNMNGLTRSIEEPHNTDENYNFYPSYGLVAVDVANAVPYVNCKFFFDRFFDM